MELDCNSPVLEDQVSVSVVTRFYIQGTVGQPNSRSNWSLVSHIHSWLVSPSIHQSINGSTIITILNSQYIEYPVIILMSSFF